MKHSGLIGLEESALNRMEDSKQFGQNQQKERVQLKIASWALCKESNVASEERQNFVSSVSAVVPETELKSEELKPEFEAKDVQKVPSAPFKEPNVAGEMGHKGSHHVRKAVKKVDNVRFGRPPLLNG